LHVRDSPTQDVRTVQARPQSSLDSDEFGRRRQRKLTPPGRFIESRLDGSIVIEVDGQELRLWNHEPEQLAEAAAASGEAIEYQARWGLLWVPSTSGRYAFCVVLSAADHVACPLQPPVGSPVELLESAGGFTVPASELLEGSS
jgi:hypothetical protein